MVAVIKELTITPGGTFLKRIPTNSNNPTRTLEKIAVIQSPTGMKYKKIKRTTIAAIAATKINKELDGSIFGYFTMILLFSIFIIVTFLPTSIKPFSLLTSKILSSKEAFPIGLISEMA